MENASRMLITHVILWCVFGNLNGYLKISASHLCAMVLMYKILNSISANCDTWDALNSISQVIIEHLLIGGRKTWRHVPAVRANTELSSGWVTEETRLSALCRVSSAGIRGALF